MSLLRARRTLCLTRIKLIKRETPDGTPPKHTSTPRFQQVTTTATKYVKGQEAGVLGIVPRHAADIKPQCPWCKATNINGKKAIVCPVWPEHTMIEAVTKPDVEREDEWRGANLTRFPVNVFNTKRYFNPKAHLAAKDPYRMTTPVSHKIDDWAVKYGTK